LNILQALLVSESTSHIHLKLAVAASLLQPNAMVSLNMTVYDIWLTTLLGDVYGIGLLMIQFYVIIEYHHRDAGKGIL
jgi:hypothetical protein